MRYVRAKAEKQAEEMAYRIYVTRGLKMLTENTTRPHGGTALAKSFEEIMRKTPVETRTGDEIIASIRDKIHSLGA